MAARNVIPAFDFSEAMALPLAQRFARSIQRARELVATNGYQRISDFPCIPMGATEAELSDFESRKLGARLPDEYRRFLSVCRYLKIDDGLEIGGLDHDGVFVTEVPWLSKQHQPGKELLIFANYWRYADGDHLLFDLSEPGPPVVAYLHEYPLFQTYAPSFSLALWRLVHEAERAKELPDDA
jgi:hypothetical protein